ncbi:hypothetical protein Q1695_013287 [Nippostrongylus brasiliensis]|nr:hypothetical protein Q1695_013287 [Nippostrongylus brasiliensis]
MLPIESALEYTVDDAQAIVESLVFTEEKKNKLAKENEAFRGIEYAKGLGTTMVGTVDIDWKEDELKNHTNYRAFPLPWEDKVAEQNQLACAVLLLAATHAMDLPIPQSQVADVVTVHLMNTIGYAQSEFTTGAKFLELQYVTPLVTKKSDYSWPGFSLFLSKIRPEFMDRMKTGNYETFNDLFVVYEIDHTKKNTSVDTTKLTGETSQLGRHIIAQAVETMPDSITTQDTASAKASELALIRKIKEFYSTRQLVSIGIALAYTLGRLVAKSVEHVLRIGKDFAQLPLRYGLDMNPTTAFQFNDQAITAIRNSMSAYSSTIATYLQSLLEVIASEQSKLHVPQKCAIQIKALFEIRLSFYGMVLPALGLSVADKLNITGENLAYISMCDLTRDGCKQFLDFLARLETQEPQYREARGFKDNQKINPRGAFRFCRLFNPDYMMKLSGTKNRNTSCGRVIV